MLVFGLKYPLLLGLFNFSSTYFQIAFKKEAVIPEELFMCCYSREILLSSYQNSVWQCICREGVLNLQNLIVSNFLIKLLIRRIIKRISLRQYSYEFPARNTSKDFLSAISAEFFTGISQRERYFCSKIYRDVS